MANFGDVLRDLRLASKMTQKTLAEKLGVTKSVVSYYELQERSPSPEILIKLSDVFHVSTDYLLGIEKNASTVLDVSGLKDEDIQFLRYTVNMLRKKNGTE